MARRSQSACHPKAPVTPKRLSPQSACLMLLAFSSLALTNTAPLLAQTSLPPESSAPANFSMKGIHRSMQAYSHVNFSQLPDVSPQDMAVQEPHSVPRPGGDTSDTILGSPNILSESPDVLQPNQDPVSLNPQSFSPSPDLASPFASPFPATSFQATTYNSSFFIPPDTDGAVGPNHLVTALNGVIQVQDRAGNLLQTKSLDTFWGVSGVGQNYAYDPTVLYDRYNDRWIVTSCARGHTHYGYILLAVSQTGDPTGTWTQWTTYPNAYLPAVLFNNGSPAEWADFDRTGFNKNWIVMQTNMYTHFDASKTSGASDKPEGTFVSVFPKAALYAGTAGQGAYLHYTLSARSDIGLTQVPAATYDNSVNQLYLLQDPGNGTQLKMFKVDGSVGNETFSSVATVNGRLGSWGFNNSGAPQAGTSALLDMGDSHINNLVYRNGSLWSAQTVTVNSRSVVQWWQMTTGGSVQQQGRINPTDGYARGYPSIAVNANNAALIGYSIFSSGTYPSAAYSYRSSSDSANTLESEVAYKSGLGPYYYIDPTSGLNRWGDYSTTLVDPLNDVNFWTIQEYAETPNFSASNYGVWGTWSAHI